MILLSTQTRVSWNSVNCAGIFRAIHFLFCQTITMHLLHHIPEGIEVYGPVYGTWMYNFERFNSWMTRRALNKCRPEATIIETYRVSLN